MPQMSKVELYAAIRRDHRDGMKLREIARKYDVWWRTVRKAVDSVWPEPWKKLPPRATAMDPCRAVVDGILRADLDAPRQQWHTVTRIFHRLVEEHGADVSYQQVRRYVVDRKPQILVGPGKVPLEAFVPQTHQPGDGGRGRLRRRDGEAGGRAGDLLPVLLPAVLLGQGGAPGVRLGWAGGVLRGPRPRAAGAGRGSAEQGPLRQPEGRRRPGAGAEPGPGRGRPVDRLQVALRDRELLLPTRHRRGPREGLCRRAGSATSGATASCRCRRSSRWRS